MRTTLVTLSLGVSCLWLPGQAWGQQGEVDAGQAPDGGAASGPRARTRAEILGVLNGGIARAVACLERHLDERPVKVMVAFTILESGKVKVREVSWAQPRKLKSEPCLRRVFASFRFEPADKDTEVSYPLMINWAD